MSDTSIETLLNQLSSEVAACLQDPPADHDPTPRLLQLLDRPIRQLAEQAGRRVQLVDLEEFVDAASLNILMPRPKRPARITRWKRQGDGSLHVWLRSVLQNLARDARLQPRFQSVRNLDERCEARPWRSVDAHEFLDEPFPEDDLALIESWTPRLRIELLCLSGLWLKAALCWDRWVHECELVLSRKFSRPFPDHDFVFRGDDPSSRMAPLGRLMGIRPNTLSQSWLRHSRRLNRLSSIQQWL